MVLLRRPFLCDMAFYEHQLQINIVCPTRFCSYQSSVQVSFFAFILYLWPFLVIFCSQQHLHEHYNNNQKEIKRTHAHYHGEMEMIFFRWTSNCFQPLSHGDSIRLGYCSPKTLCLESPEGEHLRVLYIIGSSYVVICDSSVCWFWLNFKKSTPRSLSQSSYWWAGLISTRAEII